MTADARLGGIKSDEYPAGSAAPIDDLAVDVCAGWAEQRRNLQNSGRQDDRCGKQESEAGSVLMAEPAPQVAGYRHTRPADAGQQRRDLEPADQHAIQIGERSDAPFGQPCCVELSVWPTVGCLAV